ncbi:hypothetical protein [Candidatus Lokiarchaeum ossiferum]|uniref:hypothetical protein n=1 Tax=Candidatus Lokiarchaeum ossiferum TaxID=2951803 RepID=UPI00352C6B2A
MTTISLREIELGIWLTIAIIPFVGSLLSAKGYKKWQIKPYLLLILMNVFMSLYGMLYFIGRLINNVEFIMAGFVCVNVVLMLNTSFILSIYSPRIPKLILIQIQIIFLILSIHATFSTPPQLSDEQMLFPIMEKIGMIGGLFIFFITIIGYSVFSLKKVKKRNLPKKLNIFPITLLIGIFSTLILYLLVILINIPLFFALIPGLLSFSLVAFILLFIPSSLFITPIEPLHLAIISHTGKTLFSRNFQQDIKDEVIHGAISAINVIFQKYLDPKSQLKQLLFENLVCYVEFRPHYFIILIDRYYFKQMESTLRQFVSSVDPIISNLPSDWDGDLLSLGSDILPIFEQNFKFIPEMLR